MERWKGKESMGILCVALVGIGACIMLYSIVDYYRALVYAKNKTSAKKLFSGSLNAFGFFMMVFFLVGYIVVGITFLSRETTLEDVLTAIIFVFGSMFVFIMVTLERRMSDRLFDKTGEVVRMLVNAMEAKDKYTRGHSDHVLNIVRLFYNNLPEVLKNQINLMHLMDAAILHDIGKLGIDDTVLNKTGKLSPEEWSVIRQHPELGKDILKNTSYQDIGDIIRLHHERMDGQGYYGVQGEDIPLESRVIMIADAFSALYTNRVYRTRQTFEEAMNVLREEAGTQFDKPLVDIFVKIPQQDLDAAGYVFQEKVSYVQ